MWFAYYPGRMAAPTTPPPDLGSFTALGFGLEARWRRPGEPPPRGSGWIDAAAASAPERVEGMLARVARSAGGGPAAAHGTWLVESQAWAVASAAVLGLLASGSAPALATLRFHLRVSDDGLVAGIVFGSDRLEHDDPDVMTDRVGAGLQAHLAPLVGALVDRGVRRPAPLWRAAGDRVAQGALWAGAAAGRWDEGVRTAERLVAAPAPFAVPLRAAVAPGTPLRRRAGCCLAHRVPGHDRCDDCPVAQPAATTGGAPSSS